MQELQAQEDDAFVQAQQQAWQEAQAAAKPKPKPKAKAPAAVQQPTRTTGAGRL